MKGSAKSHNWVASSGSLYALPQLFFTHQTIELELADHHYCIRWDNVHGQAGTIIVFIEVALPGRPALSHDDLYGAFANGMLFGYCGRVFAHFYYQGNND